MVDEYDELTVFMSDDMPMRVFVMVPEQGLDAFVVEEIDHDQTTVGLQALSKCPSHFQRVCKVMIRLNASMSREVNESILVARKRT